MLYLPRMKMQTINIRNSQQNLLLLLLKGKFKNDFARLRKKCLYNVIWYHLYQEEQFSIDKEETSTEQEKNKSCICKASFVPDLEDLYFATLSTHIFMTELLLLICDDSIYLLLKAVFSGLWDNKCSDFFLSFEVLCCRSGSVKKSHSVEWLSCVLNYSLDV